MCFFFGFFGVIVQDSRAVNSFCYVEKWETGELTLLVCFRWLGRKFFAQNCVIGIPAKMAPSYEGRGFVFRWMVGLELRKGQDPFTWWLSKENAKLTWIMMRFKLGTPIWSFDLIWIRTITNSVIQENPWSFWLISSERLSRTIPSKVKMPLFLLAGGVMRTMFQHFGCGLLEHNQIHLYTGYKGVNRPPGPVSQKIGSSTLSFTDSSLR